jgi:hypothetical protein
VTMLIDQLRDEGHQRYEQQEEHVEPHENPVIPPDEPENPVVWSPVRSGYNKCQEKIEEAW